MFLESANGERAEFEHIHESNRLNGDIFAVCLPHRERDEPHAPDDFDYPRSVPGLSYLGHDEQGDPWFSTQWADLGAARCHVRAAIDIEPLAAWWLRPAEEEPPADDEDDDDNGEMVEVPAALLRHLRDQWEGGDIAEPVRHLLAYLEEA